MPGHHRPVARCRDKIGCAHGHTDAIETGGCPVGQPPVVLSQSCVSVHNVPCHECRLSAPRAALPTFGRPPTSFRGEPRPQSGLPLARLCTYYPLSQFVIPPARRANFPDTAHKLRCLLLQSINASCEYINETSEYIDASCVCIFATCV